MIKTKSLFEKIKLLLIKYGVTEEDAKIIADSIVWAHIRERHTHGIGRLPIYLRKINDGLMDPRTPINTIKHTPIIDLIDVNNGFGQVAAIRGMEIAITKAKNFGVGIVGIRNSNNFGTAGYIGEYAVHSGMIGVILSNSGPAIAPQGGNKAIFGTNPICFAFPNMGDPIIFDMACSNAARGKIRLAAKNGDKIPLGWAVDENGKETQDPLEALRGTVLPIGGYKGFGLAMCVDILSGMLTGSAFGGNVKNLNHESELSRYGHFIMALNPDFFMSKQEYNQSIQTLINNIKNCGNSEKIYFPGEQSAIKAKKNLNQIEIPQKLLDEFKSLMLENKIIK